MAEPYLPRLVDGLISDLLVDLPGLLIVGPRATGKTTTARRHANRQLTAARPFHRHGSSP
ncbi:MAG: hypothetical protein ACRDTD_33635 [Pseudonocardiaceae bacterium]